MNEFLTDNRKAMGMEIRTQVLHVALHVETEIQTMLIGSLKVPANKSHDFKRLPFDTKLKFLLALDVLTKDQHKKLDWFREIRNVFIHNIEATTFEKAFNFLKEHRDTLLFEAYPQDVSKSKENRLYGAVNSLFVEVAELLVIARKKLVDRITEASLLEAHKAAHLSYQESIPDAVNDVIQILKKELEDGHVFTSEEIQNIPGRVAAHLEGMAHPRFREKLKALGLAIRPIEGGEK